MNKHCDFVPIDYMYDLMDRLKITKKEFASLCGLATPQPLYNWEKKGRMPQYRYSQLIIEMKRVFKEEYDRKLALLEFDN